ncbi:MAG: ABC transporter substrate-binding protein [Anaerolinea sp.]|nr:ABC transporter substrate-binding protein [Anaerolinea sp.]
MRKSFLLVALAALLMLAGAVSAQDQVTITLMGHGSSTAEEAALRAQVDAFMAANPNIVVDLQIVPEYDTVIRTAFASGDYPEVFYVGQDALDEFAQAGVLAPAEDNVADVDDIFPSLVQTYTYDGVFYCPAKDFSNLALEYNVDMFDAAGVAYPTNDWTWEDLRAAAQQITEATGVPGLVVNPDIDRWFSFYLQAGGTLYDEEGNFVFASEGANYDAAVEAVTFFQELFANGWAVTSQQTGAGWSGDAFGQGLAAMTMEGNWIIQYLIDTFPEVNWGAVQLPAGMGGTEATLTFSECYGVAADNEHPEESWALVNFLTGVEGAAALAEGGFGPMPTRLSSGDLWLESRGELGTAFVEGAEFAVAPVLPPGFQEFRDTLGGNLQQVIEGSMTVEEAIEDARDVADELIADM